MNDLLANRQSRFHVTLYGPGDQPVGEPFILPALPYPGLRIVWEGAVWAVDAVMVIPAHPRSVSARDGDPVQADVRVTPAEGIHDE